MLDSEHGGQLVELQRPNQIGEKSVFIYAKDTKGYVEIELTANKADVMLSWVIDTFEKEDGRTMLDLKNMLL